MTTPPLIAPDALPTDVVFLDARPSAADYAAGHLPGARHARLDMELSAAGDPGFDPARGGRHPLPPLDRWLAQLGAWGIGPETYVVVYDDAGGSNAAARTWWMLRSIGHEKVSVLDRSLRNSNLPLTTVVAPSPPSWPSYPAQAWQWPTVHMPLVDELRTNPAWRVLDVRSAPRFRGETEPIDPIAGHIPGAINLPFAENLEEGVFKSPKALRAQYQRLFGDVDPKRVVVHCGSGVTACHTLLALHAAGLPGASLYVGSWSEWCRNDKPRQP